MKKGGEYPTPEDFFSSLKPHRVQLIPLSEDAVITITERKTRSDDPYKRKPAHIVLSNIQGTVLVDFNQLLESPNASIEIGGTMQRAYGGDGFTNIGYVYIGSISSPTDIIRLLYIIGYANSPFEKKRAASLNEFFQDKSGEKFRQEVNSPFRIRRHLQRAREGVNAERFALNFALLHIERIRQSFGVDLTSDFPNREAFLHWQQQHLQSHELLWVENAFEVFEYALLFGVESLNIDVVYDSLATFPLSDSVREKLPSICEKIKLQIVQRRKKYEKNTLKKRTHRRFLLKKEKIRYLSSSLPLSFS